MVGGDRADYSPAMRLAFRPIYGAMAIFAAVIVLYLPTLRGGFVYDSIAQVLYSDYIHKPSHWGDVLTLRVVAQDELDRNRPLHLASLMFDAAIWGKNPFGYRLTSILLHALNASLLFVLVTIVLRMRTAGGRGAAATSPAASPSPAMAVWASAFFGALLFALHPLVVEAVAEPSNREDLLVVLPMLIGLLAIVSRVRSLRALNAILVLCSFFAVLAKESGIAAPFVFAVAAWLFGRVRRCLPGLITAFLVVAAFLFASYLLRPEGSAILARSPAPLAQDFPSLLATQARIWTLQIWQVIWPRNLSAHYPPQVLSGITTPLAFALLIGVLISLFFFCRKSNLAAVGMAFYVLALLPASNLVPQYHPIADRYLYVPLAGVGMIVAAMAHRVRIQYSSRLAGGVIVFAALAVLAAEYAANARRQIVWQQPVTLWSDVLRQYPGTTQALFGMANAAWRAGDFATARMHAAEAVSLSGGRWAEVLAMLAICDWKLGDRETAFKNFQQARRFSRVYSDEKSMAAALIWSPEQLHVLGEVADRCP